MDKLDQLLSSARVRERRKGKYDPEGSCIVYWMQRAQRGVDNPALDLAVDAANLLGKPAVVFFAPVPFYPHANLRHYRFLLQGIPDIAEAAAQRNVGFVLRRYPDHSLLKFCAEVKPALVIGDENPLRETERWRVLAARRLHVPFYTVDADVIVPSRLLEKAQYAPVHARRRLHARLQEFMVASRNPKAKIAWQPPKRLESLSANTDLTQGWDMDRSLDGVDTFQGGSREAARLLHEFVSKKLQRYARERNHPELGSTSRLSPYLHFGHISPITIALAVQQAHAPLEDKESYLDELLTWRELAINFVTYNPLYDSFESGENWAHKSLAEHAKDPRAVLYTRQQLESAQTHDRLWNAAQTQMVSAGWMHNYMRMYWAKKILEWSRTPAQAYNTAVYLNDRYFLDGRDPNGYAGIAWSIVGKFDRPWFDRPIFGKIRYMSGASAGKKFDSARYIEQQTQPRMF
jgi:deoxyribodipyrimidine photo-lyase